MCTPNGGPSRAVVGLSEHVGGVGCAAFSTDENDSLMATKLADYPPKPPALVGNEDVAGWRALEINQPGASLYS